MVRCVNNNLSCFFKKYPDVVVQLTSTVPIMVIVTEVKKFSTGKKHKVALEQEGEWLAGLAHIDVQFVSKVEVMT